MINDVKREKNYEVRTHKFYTFSLRMICIQCCSKLLLFFLNSHLFSRSRGLYFLTTNSNPPHARGTNFTTNTVLPVEAEPDADDDLEIDGYVESTI